MANELCKRINRLKSDGNPDAVLCVVLPMDGFHLYKRELDAMPVRVLGLNSLDPTLSWKFYRIGRKLMNGEERHGPLIHRRYYVSC